MPIWPKIGLTAPAATAASLLGGEAAFAALSEGAGFTGWAAAAADTLGALHTTFGSILGSKILDSAFPSTGGASAAGGFLIYPNQVNLNQLQSVYRKP